MDLSQKNEMQFRSLFTVHLPKEVLILMYCFRGSSDGRSGKFELLLSNTIT